MPFRGFFTSKGKRRIKKYENIHSPISGQSKIQVYLTETAIKLEDNTHKEHQPIPQTSTEYSQGTSWKNIKTTGKQEAIHSSTNATKTHKSTCEQDLKLVSYHMLFGQPSHKIRGMLQKLSTRAQFMGFK